MRVIGRTDRGYILEAEESEVARLAGAYSMGWSDWKEAVARDNIALNREGHPMIGAVIPVAEWWDRIQGIASREKDLAALSDKMRGLADLIGGAWPAITMPLPTEKKP